jgi:hypothetical protein
MGREQEFSEKNYRGINFGFRSAMYLEIEMAKMRNAEL